MRSPTLLAAVGTLASLVSAIPLAGRDVVWTTTVVEDVVTIEVTETVYLDASTTLTSYSTPTHYGHHGGYHTTTSGSAAAILTTSAVPAPPPKPPSSSSTPVPVPTTTTAQVAVSATPVSSASSAVPTPETAPSGSAGSSTANGLAAGLAASGQSYTGEITYYEPGMGSCGWTNTASENIVAVSHVIFDSYSAAAGGNPNNNPLCGKMVSIIGKDGSQHQAKVVDRCVGCAEGDLDLTQPFFNVVTSNGNGRVPGVSWSFL